MSRAKFYKCVFDEHYKLTCNREGGGGGGGGGGMGRCYYFSVDLMLSMQYICVRSEVLEMDAIPLPLLAYCKHVLATRLMYGLVSFLLSHSTATFSERYQALAGC